MSPEAVIHSISMVAQGAEDEDAKVARARINAHVSNYLARLAKEAHGDEVEGDEPYTGHVPVMEDYVKLQKKRQTFVTDVDSEEVMEYFQKATSVGEMGKGSVVFMDPGIASSTSSTPSKERPGGAFAKKISSRNLRGASIRSLTFEKEEDHSQRLDVTPDEDLDPKLKSKPDKTISFHIVSEPEEPSSHPNVLFQDGDESLASGYNTASGATTTSERSSVTSGSVRIDGSNAGEPSTDTSISGVTAENSATVVSEEDVANRENATIEGIPVEEFVNGEQTESVQNGAGSEEVGNTENVENTANTDTNAIAE